MSYSDIEEQRDTLAGLIEQQTDVLTALDMTDWADAAREVKERLLSDNFKVLVIGEFNTGKSTFIDALLRENVLPAYPIPTTAILNEVKWGEERKALLHYKAPENGTASPPKEVPVEELENYVVTPYLHSKEEWRKNPYDHVELFYPLGLCRNGVEIIDSPGLNEAQDREEITTKYLGRVDAILFVLSANTPGVSNSEELSLRRIRSSGHQDIFFIYNKINQVNPSQQEMVKDHCRDKLKVLTGRSDMRLFFINALGALEGYLDDDSASVRESGVPQLEAALETFLTEERGRIKIGRPADKLKESIGEARRTIPERRLLLQEPLDALEERYQKAQEPLQRLEVMREQTVEHVAHVHKLIERNVDNEAKSYYASLAESVNAWTGAYTVQQPMTAAELQTADAENTAAKRVSEEVAQYIANRIESETIEWQEAELQPLLTENVEELRSYLDVRMGEFLRQLDHIRAELSSGIAPSSLSDDSDEEITEPLNRVLAAIGGAAIEGTGRASIGSTLAYQGTGGSLVPLLAAGAAGLLALAASRSPTVAAFVGGGVEKAVREFFFGIQASEATTNIKNGVVQEYAKWLHENAGPESKKVAEAVGKQFGELENALSQAMDVHINGIREQVESILGEKQKGQAEVDRLVEKLTTSQEQLDDIEGQLDGLIARVQQA